MTCFKKFMTYETGFFFLNIITQTKSGGGTI